VKLEVLIDSAMNPKGIRMLEAMVNASPFEVAWVGRAYQGKGDLLMTYGIGHPHRNMWWRDHMMNGGRSVLWDRGYFKRKDAGYMRMSIDAEHPSRWLRPEHPGRFDAQGIELREDYNPNGPAVIAGLGVKALSLYKLGSLEWERGAAAELAGRPLLYKPKRSTDRKLPGVPVCLGSIEDALRGASLLRCRHSNTAIDACIAGVPVICDEGAALALYRDNPQPTREQRKRFLDSLAFWNWKPEEADACWTYLLTRL
jgi:hypothetical protein